MIEQPRVLDTPIIALTWFDLVLAGGLVLIAVGIARSQRLGVGRGFVVGAIRTVVQLTCVGYILVYILALDRWPLVVAALLLMLAVAVHTALAWQRHPSRQLYGAMGVALLAGSGLTLVYVGAIIVQVDPWYNSRYLIPLFRHDRGERDERRRAGNGASRGRDGEPTSGDRGISRPGRLRGAGDRKSVV